MTTTSPTYLETTIAESRRTDVPRYGIGADGYSLRSGAPTSILVRLDGEKRWRRLMCWQFSNAGTLFLRIGGIPYIVPEHQVPDPNNGDKR